jgi:aspartate aminotransferase-like enzyme
VISATQKGLGVPPGLSVVMASKRAIEITNSRSTPVSSYYINWQRWQPIMQAYEAGQPKYFATRESVHRETRNRRKLINSPRSIGLRPQCLAQSHH